MGGDGGKAYSPEKLEKLLRRAKVTQQSIQMVSHWMLEHRAAMADMVDLWTRLFRDGDTNHQIVNLYIANDAMQVGARKYGKHVAEVFEGKLLEIAEFVMAHCDEKVKRCLMKIVGIWKQRNIINAALLNALQNVCAGKPAFEPVVEIDAMTHVRDERAEQEAFLKQLVSGESIDRVLEDMPEVLESEMTVVTTQRLQNFVSATISADLLSDRMFQLESSLNNFSQACEAFEAKKQKTAEDDGDDASNEVVGASGGNIVWELMEQQVFDLDIEKSRDHVQQNRDNLEGQTAKREELLEHLQNLQDADLFTEPLYASSVDTLDEQCRALERLYVVCSEADSIERQREAEKQVAYMIANARVEDPFQPQNSYMRTGTSSPGGASYDYQSYRNSDSSYERGGYERHNSMPILRRHSSAVDSSRNYYDDSEDRQYGGSKRAKLQHMHSLDSYGHRSRWVMENESRQHSGDSYRPSYHQDEGHRYESSRYSPPRHERSRSSKWDRAPDDHYDDRRGGGRRW